MLLTGTPFENFPLPMPLVWFFLITFFYILLTKLKRSVLFALVIFLLLVVLKKFPHNGVNDKTNNLIGGIYKGYVSVTNPHLHGLKGYEGVDIKGGCGTPLYAPFDGRVKRVGLDGYRHQNVWPQNTILVLEAPHMRLTLLHGDYVVTPDQRVSYGDLLGFEAANGWATGCHSHIIFEQNGQLVNPLYVGQKPILVTYYDPQRGGINAWGTGTVYRNGETVHPYHYGNTAACIYSWLNKEILIGGKKYLCRDTGGQIVEGPFYYHVDLLLKEEPEYNKKFIFNWQFVKP